LPSPAVACRLLRFSGGPVFRGAGHWGDMASTSLYRETGRTTPPAAKGRDPGQEIRGFGQSPWSWKIFSVWALKGQLDADDATPAVTASYSDFDIIGRFV